MIIIRKEKNPKIYFNEKEVDMLEQNKVDKIEVIENNEVIAQIIPSEALQCLTDDCSITFETFTIS